MQPPFSGRLRTRVEMGQRLVHRERTDNITDEPSPVYIVMPGDGHKQDALVVEHLQLAGSGLLVRNILHVPQQVDENPLVLDGRFHLYRITEKLQLHVCSFWELVTRQLRDMLAFKPAFYIIQHTITFCQYHLALLSKKLQATSYQLQPSLWISLFSTLKPKTRLRKSARLDTFPRRARLRSAEHT